MEGSDGTCEGSEDTTTLVRIEELKCDIRKLPYVTVLAPVRAVGDNPLSNGDLCELTQIGEDLIGQDDLCREEVRVPGPQVGGVQGDQVLRRGQCPRR